IDLPATASTGKSSIALGRREGQDLLLLGPHRQGQQQQGTKEGHRQVRACFTYWIVHSFFHFKLRSRSPGMGPIKTMGRAGPWPYPPHWLKLTITPYWSQRGSPMPSSNRSWLVTV